MSSSGDESPAHEYMKLALEQAKLALHNLEVPVGCVIVEDGKVIASGSNRTTETRNATRHAEMEATDILLEQWQKSGFSQLEVAEKFSRCDLYVTCEPCIMCAAALSILGLRAVYYGCANDKFGGCGSILSLHATTAEQFPSRKAFQEKGFKCTGGIMASEAIALLRSFYDQGNPNDPPMLSTDQERKLQAVRVHPDKDLGVLIPKESGRTSVPPDSSSFGRTSGPRSRSSIRKAINRKMSRAFLSGRDTPPSKAARIDNTSLGTSPPVTFKVSSPLSSPPSRSSIRKAINRKMSRAFLSGRDTPPSKAARIDNTSLGTSLPVTFKVSSPLSSPPAGPRACPYRVASVVVPSQPTTTSTKTVTPGSSSPATASAPHLCPPRSGTSTGAPTWAGPMLGNPLVIREKLERFVFPLEVTQINALGTEGVIDKFLEGLAQASTASICLLSKAQSHSQLKKDNETMQKELSVAQGKITALEATGRAFEADLTAARERATRFETELSAAHERAAKAEAELVKARERASLSEAELTQTRERVMLREIVVESEMRASHERACRAEERAALAERDLADGLADAFIDSYDELRGKISATFPNIDLSGFMPTKAPDDGSDSSDDAEDDEEEDGSSYKSD